MNLSGLQQIIGEKETELARIRQAAAEAAQHQEEEARERTMHMLESMELEMEHVRQESELAIKDAIREVESGAAATIERAKREMEQELLQREEDIFKAAGSKMEEEWALREDCIREELQEILSMELKDQHIKLTTHYELIIQGKDETMKAFEDSAKHQMSELETAHQRQMEGMRQKMEDVATEIWNDACEKFGVAADEEISHNLAMADEHCNARDEQISMLIEERSVLREQLNERESLLQESVRGLNKMEIAVEEAAAENNARHDEEFAKLSKEAASLMKDNEQLRKVLHAMEAENEALKGEMNQFRLKHKSLETKYSEQREMINTFDCEKQRLQSRISELSACKQLLERQLLDSKKENQELVTNSDILNKRIDELVFANESITNKAKELTNSVDELQQKNHNLEQMHDDAKARVNSLKQERWEYTREMEDRIKQKDMLLAETLDTIRHGSKSKTEPVVVHLHGDGGDKSNTYGGNERLSSECNSLRSKVLQLQRENFRLESELMIMKQRGHMNRTDQEGGDVRSLQQENNSLKTIITMMRKEMETVASNNDSEGENSSLPSELVIEQQLVQCRSYLDLLLKGRDSSDDEVAFLRSKYDELHRTADELREENSKLHMMCNRSSVINGNGDTTTREQELIQKLEEATDEIEALLRENEKIMQVSNELRFELQKTRGELSSRLDSRQLSQPDSQKDTQEYEQTMLDAILNDQSRSCDSESHESEVACIGRKPPLSSAADYRQSKTAYGSRPTTASNRATNSQRESLQRMLNRKKKEVAVEKTKIRNWNVKDPSTNPYL
ncbi:hypothetical protein ACHAXR_011407 [Thalassiosira sp. AJA248-18]